MAAVAALSAAGCSGNDKETQCKPGGPPSGLSQVVAGEANGLHAVLTLDGDGLPVVAYQTTTGDGSASQISVWLVRWDAGCGKWGAPMVVDTFGDQTGNGRQIALAYDASNGTVGMAYQAIIGTLAGEHHYEIRYAELAKGATVVTAPRRVEQVRNPDPQPASPGLGMANGKVFVAYVEPFRLCNTSGCGAVVYRSRGADGNWTAEAELPGNGPSANGDALDSNTSIAVDSAGNPAVAWISAGQVDGGGVKMRATFVRPGAAAPSLIFENADTTGTDNPWVELAFDGTKPRTVVLLNRDASWATSDNTAWFVASNDGASWDAPVALPHDHKTSLDFYASIAIGPQGKVVTALNSNAGDGSGVFGQPKLLTSTDSSHFVVGGVPKDVYDATANFVSAKIGADGKLQLVWRAPAGPDPKKVGVLYWREP